MKYYLRVFGWLFLGMGAALSLLGLLALTQLIQVQINFFGIDLNTNREHIAWIVGWLVATVAGFALLLSTRRSGQHESL